MTLRTQHVSKWMCKWWTSLWFIEIPLINYLALIWTLKCWNYTLTLNNVLLSNDKAMIKLLLLLVALHVQILASDSFSLFHSVSLFTICEHIYSLFQVSDLLNVAFNSHLSLTAGQLEILRLLHVQAFKGKSLSLSFCLRLTPLFAHLFLLFWMPTSPHLHPPVSMPFCNRLVSITKGGLDICWWMSMAAGSLMDSAVECAPGRSALAN